MASTAEAAALSETHRQRQLALRALVTAQLLLLWPAFDIRDIDASWERLEPAILALIAQGRSISSALATAYFREFRAAEQISGLIPSLAPLDAAWENAARVSLRVTGPVAAKQLIAANSQNAADVAFVRMSGAASRIVLNGGRDSLQNFIKADRRALGYARVTDGAPCAFCALIAGRGPVYKSQRSAGFNAHDHCVLGATTVSGPRFETGFRRWYEGEVVIIGTSDGGELTITPKHPVLTNRGWVEPELLRVGDYLAHRLRSDLVTGRAPDKEKVPTAIEDVWSAMRVDGLINVPPSPEDFHGDGIGTKGEIDVVTPDGLFAHIADAKSVEFSDDRLDAGARAPAIAGSFASSRDVGLPFFGSGSLADSLVGSSGVALADFWGEILIPEQLGFADSSSRHSCLYEPSLHRSARDAMSESERLLSLSSNVGSDHPFGLLGAKGAGPPQFGPRYNPPAQENEAERIRVHADYGRRLLERLTGLVEFLRVTNLRRVHYAGHVFNLQTAEGWYDANSIVVSNCACFGEPVYFRDTAWPGRGREFQALYRSSTAGAKEPLKAFRRAYEGR